MASQNKIHFWYALLTFFSILFIPTAAKTQEHTLWKEIGLYGGQIPAIAITPGTSSVLYAGSWGGDGLFKSTDGGMSWFSIPQDNPSWFRNYEVYDIAIDPNNPETVWVANNYFVDVSRDAGTTWQTFFFAKDERRFCYTVAVDPHDQSGDTVYVGTGGPDYSDEYGEIFVTRDGGTSWDKMNFSSDFIRHNFWNITFNPNKSGEIWIANRKSYLSPDGLIIVSPDNGDSWWYWNAAYWPAQDSYYVFGYLDEIVVNPLNPLSIFACSQYGIARKLDGSNLQTHWLWTSLVNGCRSLCIPAAAPSTLYAGLVDTIAISTDDGETWDTSRTAPAEFLTMQADDAPAPRLYAGSVNRGIFTTTDGAQTWSEINTGIRANTIYDSALTSTDSEVWILCGTLSGVYLSRDQKTWKRIYNTESKAVSFHPDDPQTLYAGTGFGTGWEILKSTTSGESWRYISSPEEEESTIASIAVIPMPPDNDTIIAGVAFGSGKKGQVIKITNWGFGSYDRLETLLETEVRVNAVCVHPENPQCIMVGTGNFFAPVAPGGLFITQNGGRTWRNALPLQQLVVNCIACAPSDPNIMYAGCGGSNAQYCAILKSTNGGWTWNTVTRGLPQHYAVRDLMIDSQNSDIVYAVLYKGYNETSNNLGGTYVTLDGGSYWTRVGLSDYRMYDINVLSIRPEQSTSARLTTSGAVSIPATTLYAGSASGMYQATTAGTGILTGAVVSDTGAAIDGAMITTDVGCGSQSSQGYYLLMLPAGIHSLHVTAPGYAPLLVPSVSVAAGSSSEQKIIMTSAASDNATTCIATRLLQGYRNTAQHLTCLRQFRDNVLAASPAGRALINHYYRLGQGIWQVVAQNPHLRQRATLLIAQALQRALYETRSVPPGCRDILSSFLVDVETCAPLPLRNDIRALRCDLRHLDDEDSRLGDSQPSPW